MDQISIHRQQNSLGKLISNKFYLYFEDLTEYNWIIMPQIRNFAEAHTVLSKYVSRNSKPGSYSLGRMQKLMQKLGNPQNRIKIIHVAGTSGKTSTCYYIAALLQAAGQKVGLTVSPHVDEVNERVQINLTPLTEQDFCQKLSEFIDIVNKTGVEPTYFELLIGLAYWVFAQQNVDYAVVEVGLGGLLDGTNVINNQNKICVITDIGLDHTNVLGSTLTEIATQKAGIIGSHNPVFMFTQPAEVMLPIKRRVKQQHAQLHELRPLVKNTQKYLPPFQQRNWHLAKTVYDFIAERDNLKILDTKQLTKASHTIVPARMEIIEFGGRTIVIDGSHNGQKMEALAKGMQKLFPGKSVAALVSFVTSESSRAPGALEQLLPITSSLMVTSFSGEQDTPKHSVGPKVIATIAKKLGFKNVTVVSDPGQAFTTLLNQTEDILLVTGSFYLLNHIRPLMLVK